MFDYYDESTRIATVAERFEAQKHLQLTPNTPSHSHGKEYHFSQDWSGEGQKFINYKIDFYNCYLYYLELGYLVSCREDCTDHKLLIKISDHFTTDMAVSVTASTVFLAVNETGIYLYQHGKQLLVRHFSLDGQLIKSHTVSGNISQVYIAKGHLYYVLSKGEPKQMACVLSMADDVTSTLFTATSILELYGDEERAVLHATFQKTVQDHSIEDEGWYLCPLDDQPATCLTSGNCPPHCVWDNIERYLPGNPQYVEFKDKLKIRAVDLWRNIMWIATPLKERLADGIVSLEYWEPMTLAPEGAPITDAPIWRITSGQFTPGKFEKQVNEASYFDGTCFLSGRSLYIMKSYTVEGNTFFYGQSQSRGACHHFRVLNGHVYSNFDGNGWEQCKICQYHLSFVRPCNIALLDPNNSPLKPLIKAFSQR